MVSEIQIVAQIKLVINNRLQSPRNLGFTARIDWSVNAARANSPLSS